MSPSFQQISEEQLPELVEWEKLCFPNDPWSDKMLRTHLEFHAGYVCLDSVVKGYALICETPWEVEIFRIATIPAFTRLGVSTSLLNHLFTIFPKKDFFLEVKEQNKAAFTLYKKVGFEELETRKNYYPDGSTAVIMTRKTIS